MLYMFCREKKLNTFIIKNRLYFTLYKGDAEKALTLHVLYIYHTVVFH